MAFQAPFEIAQSQLRRLRISSVDSREVVGGIFPFFDPGGAVHFLAIDTLSTQRPEEQGGLWVVEEFPLEIRLGKAIYPRPITRYKPLGELEPAAFQGLYHFDELKTLAAPGALPEHLDSVLSGGNMALRARGKESIRDLFFTLDLRRLTGGLSRAGLLFRSRLEIAALKGFLRDTEPQTSL